MHSFIKNIEFFFFFFLVILFVLTYHPSVVTITESGVDTHGGFLGPSVMIGFLLLFALCFNLKELFISKVIKKLTTFLIFVLFFSGVDFRRESDLEAVADGVEIV